MAIQWQRLFTAEEHATWTNLWIKPYGPGARRGYILYSSPHLGSSHAVKMCCADSIEELEKWAGEYSLTVRR